VGKELIMRDDNLVKSEVVDRLRLEKLKGEYAEKVAAAVEAFPSSGVDLERELDRQAEKLPGEIVADCKAVNARLWRKVKPKREPRIGLIGFPVPKPKPAPANDVGPQIEVVPNVPRDAKLALEVEIEETADEEPATGGDEWEPIVWQLPKIADTPQLSRKAPLDNAKLFTRHKLEYSADSKASSPGTYFYQGDWWQWNGAFYERAPEQRMIDMACEYMDKATINTGEGMARFKPTPRDITSLITLLQSNVGLDDRTTPPAWLDQRPTPAPEGLLAFRNCLVDVTTGKTYPHEPWLWIHDGVDFDYDRNARCPRWERFLRELFPNDDEAREMIEEQLGYGMTIDNQFEKAALWVGPPRSGRGTIAHIQELLVGVNGYTSLNLHTWHKTENSRMGMIGKRVGIFHDIRLRPPKQYGNVSYDPGGVDPQSQQLLLELISGDLTEIGRKYLEAWKGKPFIKFILISNKVPNFNDEVLITRFNVLEFTESWLGREDATLKLKVLPSELPGIANRCLAAYRRLLRQGHFVQPQSGLALLRRVKAAVSPYVAFMETYWEPDPMGEGTLVKLFDATFRHWCLQTETFDLAGTSKSNMIQEIKKIPKWTWLKAFRPSTDDRRRRYRVKLKAGAKIPDEVLRGDYYDETGMDALSA
jgi:putative DNA primase/helicase